MPNRCYLHASQIFSVLRAGFRYNIRRQIIIAFSVSSFSAASIAVDIEQMIRSNQEAQNAPLPTIAERLTRKLETFSLSGSPRSTKEILTSASSGNIVGNEWRLGYKRAWVANLAMFGGGGSLSDRINAEWEMMARSKILANAIEQEIGERIPFDPLGYVAADERDRDSPLDNNNQNCTNIYTFFLPSKGCKTATGFRGQSREETCALLTPNLLSSGVTSVANQRRFKTEKASPGRYASFLEEQESREIAYLGELIQILKDACDEDDQRGNPKTRFVAAYIKFLGEFASSIDQGIANETTNALRIASTKRQAAEKQNAEFLQQQEGRRAAQLATLTERTWALRAGRIKPQSLEDAKLLWNPSDGQSIVLQPPIHADNGFYIISGKLVRIIGSQYIFEVTTGSDLKYFVGERSGSDTLILGQPPRYEAWSTIVGRFVRIAPYETIAGVTRMAPIFQMLTIAR